MKGTQENIAFFSYKRQKFILLYAIKVLVIVLRLEFTFFAAVVVVVVVFRNDAHFIRPVGCLQSYLELLY